MANVEHWRCVCCVCLQIIGVEALQSLNDVETAVQAKFAEALALGADLMLPAIET